MPADPEEIDLRKIEPGDKLTGLKLGDEAYTPLKTFLQKHAKTFLDQRLAVSYGAFDNARKVIAYVTLVCGEISAENGVGLLPGQGYYPYLTYPAIKIARLAVDQRWRDRGLGRTLVDLSLGIANDTICPAIGCRFVVVDSKRQSVSFYGKCGFTLLDTEENRERQEPIMFVDLKKA